MKLSIILFYLALVVVEVYSNCLPYTTRPYTTKVLHKRDSDDCRRKGGTLTWTKKGCIQVTTCIITKPLKTTPTPPISIRPITNTQSTASLSSTKSNTTKPVVSTKCLPVFRTITEKETITKKETVTVTVKEEASPVTDDSECGDKWAPCDGVDFKGAKCCKSGLTCKQVNKYFSQCL